MSLLINLVTDRIHAGLGTGGDGSVGVLGDVLVCFLGGGATGALDGLGDVVGCVSKEGVLVHTCRWVTG